MHAVARTSGAKMVAALALRSPAPVMLLIGGAASMGAADMEAVQRVFTAELMDHLDVANLAVLDGGTQAGIAQVMGHCRATSDAAWSLIGVCPSSKVTWPEGPQADERFPLDPNHSHFVLTAGAEWGCEVAYAQRLAAALAGEAASVAVLVNGGAIARQEVLANVAHGREVLVLNGSGRLADQLAALLRTPPAAPEDKELSLALRNGRITVVDLAAGPAHLAAVLRRKLVGDSTQRNSR